jgi:hypothetical protein
MNFGDKTWKGARIEPGSTRRNGVALWQISVDADYHKLSRFFFWNGRMLCGARQQGLSEDYVRVNRADVHAWNVCERCVSHRDF